METASRGNAGFRTTTRPPAISGTPAHQVLWPEESVARVPRAGEALAAGYGGGLGAAVLPMEVGQVPGQVGVNGVDRQESQALEHT